MWEIVIMILTFLVVIVIFVYNIPIRDIKPNPPQPPIPPIPPIPPTPPVVIPPIIEYNNNWIFTFINENEPTIIYIAVRDPGGGLAVSHSFPIDITAEFDLQPYSPGPGLDYIMYANFTDSATTAYPFVTPI